MEDAIFIRRGGDAARGSHTDRRDPAISRTLARIVLSLVLSLVPPILAFRLLEGGGSLGWILTYLLLVEALGVYRLLRPRDGGFLGGFLPWLRGGLFVLGALVIFASLDITPASAFLAWFALVAKGSAGGTIAYMFVVMFTFFSAVFSQVALAGDLPFSVGGLAAIDLFIWGVVHGESSLAVGAVILFVVALLYLAGRRLGRISGRSIVGIVQVATVTALLAVPISGAIARNGIIDGLFSLQLNGVVAAIFPNFPFLYDVPGYGNSFASTLLGQRPHLTSRPVFEVTGPPGATVYLRTGVYDVYTGTGWRLSRYERHRGTLSAYFYDYGPRRLPPSATETITVKLLADFYNSLPNTLDTIGFEFPNRSTPALSYGSLDSGFVLNTPITRGTVIKDVIDTSARPAAGFGFIENLPGFDGRRGLFGGEGRRAAAWRFGKGSFSLSGRESTWTDSLPIWLRGASMVPSRYSITRREAKIDLQTGNLPKQVVDLARSLNRPTELATIAAIRSYLKSHYLYSLSTRAAGPAGDTVDDFLFHSRTGYCVQFATAFVILARLDGIPARYVTGFLVYLPQHGTRAVVTGLSAHAWAEVWTRTQGWATVEATPPMIAADFSDPQFYAHFNPTDSSVTKQELEAVLGNRVPVSAAPRAHHAARVPRSPQETAHILETAAGVIAFAALAFIAFFVSRRMAPAEVRLRRLVNRMVRLSRSRNLPDPGRDGWSVWAAELAGRHPRRRAVTLRAGDVILSRYFGGRSRNGRDLHFLERFYWYAFRPSSFRGASSPSASGRRGRSGSTARDSVAEAVGSARR